MIKLPNITLVCVDCINHNAAIHAIKQSIKEIKFGKVLFLTDRQFYSTKFKVKIIDTIKSKEQYSEFMIKELGNYIDTEFCLVIQADGFIINPKLWDNDWLNYDYIGAPWWYDSDNVGNGGFSLRSKTLLKVVSGYIGYYSNVISPIELHPEDDFICRKLRFLLKTEFNIKFAPEEIAAKFSYEPNKKYPKFLNNTFGFHGLVLKN